MLSAPTTTCANHRKRARVAACGVCGNDLCVDCVVHTAVGIKCRKCTGGAAATAPTAAKAAKVAKGAAASPSGMPAAGADGNDAPRRKWAVPVAILGALVILGTGFALIQGGGSSDTTTSSSSGGGEQAVGDTTEIVDRVGNFNGAGGLPIGATLTLPAGVGSKKAPGIVIVPGGATVDRNGLTTQVQQNDPLYEDLAKSLAGAGIASLRYDPRGSKGSPLPDGQSKSFEDLFLDAKSGLDFLAARRETQGAPLGLIGYDTGGFVAMSLAAADPRVKGLVLISTPGRPLAEVLAADFVREVPDPAQGQALAEAVKTTATEVVATGQLPRAETLPPSLRPIFAGDAPYLRGLFGFNPVGEARRVLVPTLVVRGGNDASITDADVIQLTSNLTRGEQLLSPLGGNSLSLPPGQEGQFHNPARHGTTRDGDALVNINDWLKSRLTI